MHLQRRYTKSNYYFQDFANSSVGSKNATTLQKDTLQKMDNSALTGLQDKERIKYHYAYINEMLKAVVIDGVNVTAYTVWSLLDNFEVS